MIAENIRDINGNRASIVIDSGTPVGSKRLQGIAEFLAD